MCSDTTRGALVSSPSCSSPTRLPHSFLFLTQKIKAAVQLVLFTFYHQVLPVFRLKHQTRKQTNAFPSAPEFLSLSDSVVRVSEGGDREHAAGLLEVGTRRGKVVVLMSSLLKQI